MPRSRPTIAAIRADQRRAQRLPSVARSTRRLSDACMPSTARCAPKCLHGRSLTHRPRPPRAYAPLCNRRRHERLESPRRLQISLPVARGRHLRMSATAARRLLDGCSTAAHSRQLRISSPAADECRLEDAMRQNRLRSAVSLRLAPPQMIPHHTNAISMSRLLLKHVPPHELAAAAYDDGEGGRLPDLLWSIINAQAFQVRATPNESSPRAHAPHACSRHRTRRADARTHARTRAPSHCHDGPNE